jgi:hypothetical protein
VIYDPANKYYVRDYNSIVEFNPSIFEQEKFIYPPFFTNGADYTITAIDMYANLLFLSIVNKGIYYRTSNGYWHAANDGLSTFAVNDIAFAGEHIYVGANAQVYRMNIKDLNLAKKREVSVN